MQILLVVAVFTAMGMALAFSSDPNFGCCIFDPSIMVDSALSKLAT
jgi:hypothetical protein